MYFKMIGHESQKSILGSVKKCTGRRCFSISAAVVSPPVPPVTHPANDFVDLKQLYLQREGEYRCVGDSVYIVKVKSKACR